MLLHQQDSSDFQVNMHSKHQQLKDIGTLHLQTPSTTQQLLSADINVVLHKYPAPQTASLQTTVAVDFEPHLNTSVSTVIVLSRVASNSPVTKQIGIVPTS
jgi:predicted NAD/FAD-dependent oxidoreductase